MTKDTGSLIRRLAKNVEPVRPLAGPWVRTATWLALGSPYLLLVVFVMSPRADLVQKVADHRFLIEQVAALATGVAAAAAAFASVVPGYRRMLLALPLLPFAVWLGTLGRGCVQDWMQLGPNGLTVRPDWLCLPGIVMVGAVPAVAMAFMLRRGAPLTPRLSTALGGLAAAGLGNFGLRLFHPQDASVMVLVWQFGTVCALSALAAGAGRLVLNWPSIRQPRTPQTTA